jgi:hypothetical protein
MRAVGWSGFVAGLLVAWVTTAGAQENGFAGRKLVIVDKYDVSGRAKLVFVSKDGTQGAIHHGAAASPPALSGTVEVGQFCGDYRVEVYRNRLKSSKQWTEATLLPPACKTSREKDTLSR